MPALRPVVKRARLWIILVVAAVLAAAAAFDWNRPAPRQTSVYLYEHFVIRSYRALVRPAISSVVRCRYIPTCSEYSLQAVQVYGLPKGLWLTTRRVFRCMPWVPMGTFDPIPPRHPLPKGQ